MARRGDRGSRESRLAEGWTVEEGPSTGARDDVPQSAAAGAAASDAQALGATEAVSAPAVPERPQLSSGALVLLGVIGGVYLLYTMVWFSWAKYYSSANSELADGSGVLGSVMQQLVFWIAPFAPALWFCAVLVLNRGARLGRLVLWLLVGAILLLPLPMLDFGAAG